MLCLKGKTHKNGGNFLSNTINAQRQWNNNFKMLKPREEEEEKSPVILDIWMLKKISNKNEDESATLETIWQFLQKT